MWLDPCMTEIPPIIPGKRVWGSAPKCLYVVAQTHLSMCRFSIRFSASNPKFGKGFLAGRPNRPARPALSRIGPLSSCPEAPETERAQRLSGVSTEQFPNRSDPGAEGPRTPRASGVTIKA